MLCLAGRKRRVDVCDRAASTENDHVCAELDAKLALNTVAIKALLDEAMEAKVLLEDFALMVGVSRQALYHWRDGT
jgi:hypothetical protein